MSQQLLHPQAQALADFLQQQPLDQNLLNQAIAGFTAISTYDPNDDILPPWIVEDVQQAARMMTNSTKTVSAEHASLVLQKAAEDYDANIGVDWGVVQMHISQLESSGQIKLRRLQKHFTFRPSRQRQQLRSKH